MYKRPVNKNKLEKTQKIKLLEEYTKYYEDVKNSQGFEKLNIKIPREMLSAITDEVGTLLIEKSNELSQKGVIKDFLDNNPLPKNMAKLLPDEFRAFCLILNALKQWVAAEQSATDRYLLGGDAKPMLKESAKICIITDELLSKDAQLHHPLRDGRPPILISKKGHDLIEHQQGNSDDDNGDQIWQKMKSLREKRNQAWKQLREGCNAILDTSRECRANAKSFANVIIRETGLNAKEIIKKLDSKKV